MIPNVAICIHIQEKWRMFRKTIKSIRCQRLLNDLYCDSNAHNNKTQENEISTRDRMILHLEFHPGNISRKIVPDLLIEHCDKYLSKKMKMVILESSRLYLPNQDWKFWETCYRKQDCTSYLGRKCQLSFRGQCFITLATLFVQEIWISPEPNTGIPAVTPDSPQLREYLGI